jgi:hypothetical protein
MTRQPMPRHRQHMLCQSSADPGAITQDPGYHMQTAPAHGRLAGRKRYFVTHMGEIQPVYCTNDLG